MARKLLLYQYISPNNEDNTHFVFNTINQYISAIQDNLVKTIDLDNYRINSNVIKVNLSGQLVQNYDNITYAIDYDDNVQKPYMRCYFIESYSLQSGFVSFQCRVDNWANYIYKANMYNFVVNRCNRNIGVGVYDDITATNGDLDHVEAWEQSGAEGCGGIKDTNVCIVFLLQYNVAQAVFGGDKISKTEMFCIKLSELKAKAVERHSAFDDYSSAEIAVDIIGGIYAVTANVGTNDAQVIKAWLCHYNYIDTGRDLSLEHGITAKSKSIFTNGSDMTFDITHVYPSKDYKHITISNYDINKIYYAGTFNNGLKLQRFTTNNLDYYTYYIVGDDDIKVIVQQGEYQKDISSAYEVLLTTNSATQTGIRRVASALTGSMKAYSSATKAYATGGPAMAGLSGLETIAGMVAKEDYESAIGGGDGFTTFYQEQFRTFTKGLLLTPYILTTFTSTMNEKKKARLFGASFKVFFENNPFKNIEANYAYLGEPLFESEDDPTFIACNCVIYGVPMEAKTEITNKLKAGIYYHCLY